MLVEHTQRMVKATDHDGHTYARKSDGEWLYRGIRRRLWCPLEEADVPANFKDAICGDAMVSLPRTCPHCGSSLMHYGQCPCQIPPASLDVTMKDGIASIREATIDATIAIVAECERLGLPYDRCLHYLRNFKASV